MRRTIRRKTMVELKAAIYAANGWKRAAGESMGERVKAHYDFTVDHKRGELIATPKRDGAPPQDGVLDRWKKLR